MIGIKGWKIAWTKRTTPDPMTSVGFNWNGQVMFIEFHPDAAHVKPQTGDHLVLPQMDGPGRFVIVAVPNPERDALVERFLKSRDIDQFTPEEREIILYPGGRPSK